MFKYLAKTAQIRKTQSFNYQIMRYWSAEIIKPLSLSSTSRFSTNASISSKSSVNAAENLEQNKDRVNKVFSSLQKEQPKEEKNNRDGPNEEEPKNQNTGKSKSKINQLIALITAIAGLLKAEAETGIFWSTLNNFMETQLNHHKVLKGQLIKQKASSHKIDGQLKQFQCTNTQQELQIEKVYNFEDHKVVQYLECFIGNGFATNLVRYIARKINLQQKQKGESNTNLYFYDFKQPVHVKKGADSEWGEATELHNLLTNFIHHGKSQKKQILIINQIQLLANSFETLKADKLNELFKQIIHINKEKIARIILISSNHYFFDTYLKKLNSVHLQDFRKEIHQQITDEDAKKIIKCRIAYDKILPELSEAQKNNLNSIINIIVKNNDCIKEVMRILKQAKLDAKDLYEKYLKSKKTQNSEATLNEFLKTVFLPTLNDFPAKFKIVDSECDKVIKLNQDHLLKSIGISVYKNLHPKVIQRLKLVQNYKIQILNDIRNGRYQCQKAQNAFYLDYDDAKLQAFRELNNDEILHGFKFASKSAAIAFKKALNNNAHYLSTRWYWRVVRWFD